MKLLFCNIGWMEEYKGITPEDKIYNGGSYVKQNKTGHEVCNFNSHKNFVYGFVRPQNEQINLERISSEVNNDFLENVTVIWVAPDPSGGTFIIGWYLDATVYRYYRNFKNTPKIYSRNKIDGYYIKASSENIKLLKVDERTLNLPRGKKGSIGQSNIWYANSLESKPLVEKVLAYIKKGGGLPIKKKNIDQNRKQLVEKRAIDACCNHYEKIGYIVSNVEKENLGWDLVAKFGKKSLLIEVKGLSGSEFNIGLTPNEYKKFIEKDVDYRLVVATNTLSDLILFICRYNKSTNVWVVEGSKKRKLNIKKIESAMISC